MDVKSAFLNGVISKEVYVKQPLGFEDQSIQIMFSNLKNHYMDSNKLLELGMRDWVNFMLENGFHKGQVDSTLFRKTLKNDILISQVYVDDIIFF